MSLTAFSPWLLRVPGFCLISEMKAMAKENRRLKRMYADVSMQIDLLN
jgi:putative transposase